MNKKSMILFLKNLLFHDFKKDNLVSKRAMNQVKGIQFLHCFGRLHREDLIKLQVEYDSGFSRSENIIDFLLITCSLITKSPHNLSCIRGKNPMKDSYFLHCLGRIKHGLLG